MSTEREKNFKEASAIASEVADALREGWFGDEYTSREIRDAAELVGSVLHRMAEDAELTVAQALDYGW